MFYVYKITCLTNNKVYIGKAANVHKRWLKHLSTARTKRKMYVFHYAINKHGIENFVVETIEEQESETIVLEREMYWIAFYKSNIYKYGNEYGYNLTDGGDGASGRIKSEDERTKISKALTGKPLSEGHKKLLSKAHIGKQLSAEHCKKIGDAVRGLKRSEEAKENYRSSKKGNKNPQAILTEENVREIKEILAEDKNASPKKIGEKYGVAPRTIRDIKNEKTWKHITNEEAIITHT